MTGSNQSNDDLAKLVDATFDRWGRIDVLINSAGHGPRAPIVKLTDEDGHAGMEVYFLNAVRPTRLVTPVMQKQKSGVIINISTFAAFEPDPVFPDFRRVPRRSGHFCKAVFRSVLRRQHPNEQCPSRFHRQPVGESGLQGTHPNGTLRKNRRDCRNHRFSGVRRWRLYHRIEYPGGWRNYARDLTRAAAQQAQPDQTDTQDGQSSGLRHRRKHGWRR